MTDVVDDGSVVPINKARADRQWQQLMTDHGYDRKTDSNDPYQVIGTHSRDSFYLSAADKRGFGAAVRARLSPQVLTEITAHIQSGKYPWRTVGQFINDAVWHRLHDLAEWTKDGQLIRTLTSEMMLSDIEVHDREMKALVGIVEGFERSAEMAVKLGDWPMLTTMLIRIDERMDEVREPYRRQLQGLMAKYRAQMPEEYRPEFS